jgi:hypothetical protein
MRVQYSDRADSVIWGGGQTIFAAAKAAGYNTGVAGWYLPYCRVLSDDLNACSWQEMSFAYNSAGTGFLHVMMAQTRGLFETNLLSLFGQTIVTAAHARRYTDNLERARDFAADARLDLVFLHIPSTHVPYFYDRQTGTPVLKNSLVAGYTDALALADRTLQELRLAMQAANLWDRTAVLVTSDHEMRQSASLDGKTDRRIPFLLRMGGGSTALSMHQQFNTILTRHLVMSILRGSIRTTQEASEWITAHTDCDGAVLVPGQ